MHKSDIAASVPHEPTSPYGVLDFEWMPMLLQITSISLLWRSSVYRAAVRNKLVHIFPSSREAQCLASHYVFLAAYYANCLTLGGLHGHPQYVKTRPEQCADHILPILWSVCCVFWWSTNKSGSHLKGVGWNLFLLWILFPIRQGLWCEYRDLWCKHADHTGPKCSGFISLQGRKVFCKLLYSGSIFTQRVSDICHCNINDT